MTSASSRLVGIPSSTPSTDSLIITHQVQSRLATSSALTGKRILLVGINFAPEPTGIAPYTTRIAEYLAGVAAEVEILTGVPHYPGWTVPADFRWMFRRTVRSVAPEVRATRLRHYVPRRQTALRRATYEATFLTQVLTTRLQSKPDLLIAVTPSLGGALGAARMARRHRVPLLTIVQDLMAEAASQSGIDGGRSCAGLAGRLERQALRGADRVAIVSESFRDPVLSYGVPPEAIDLLPNWTHVRAVPTPPDLARKKLGWVPDVFTVVHTGNMGLKQDLGNVIEAARLLCTDHAVRIVLVGDGSQRKSLEEQAGALPNVQFVDPLSTENYPLALAAADVLLVNERPTVGNMSLPSKLTSYLSAGKPVLAAVWPGGATGLELTRTNGAALRVDPGVPAKLAAGIHELQTDPHRRNLMGIAARGFAEAQLGQASAMVRLEESLTALLKLPLPH